MKRKIIKSSLFVLILAISIYTTHALTYNKALQSGYKHGYDYAVQSARLTEENETSYIITYGTDDGNEYIK